MKEFLKKFKRIMLHATPREQILVTTVFFFVLFFVMFIYLGLFVKNNEEKLLSNGYNKRQETLASRNYRGKIYSRDGEVLAFSEVNDDQKEFRFYPYGKLFAHAVGYSTTGKMGVELLSNYYLINSGASLTEKIENDAVGIKNPGHNVYTTLDVELQQIADNYLNVYDGAVVVTEIKTGKILAMVSHPNFDPSTISEQWDELVKDEDSSVLVNRVTQGLYPPGSTFKMITALEYYREHGELWKNYRYVCSGRFDHDGYSIKCFNGSVHGELDLTQAFARSCNSSFADLGMSIDRKGFDTLCNSLLFNKDLPTDLVTSKSSIPSSAEMDSFAMMQTSIGQGKTAITPLHLNMITMAAANGGILMKPRMIDHVENVAGQTVRRYEDEEYGRLMSVDESLFLRGLMESVVETGTAGKLKNDKYKAAGKTGSAEYGDEGDSHAWFTGYAPAEDPEVAVTIIIEGAGTGGDYAVPLAKRLFDSYFEQKEP